MFLDKIGKTKHKYKARFTLTKITNKSAVKGLCFKVKIERGSHEVELISLPTKGGIAKFKEQQLIIPMTLYYDQNNKKQAYIQKQATFKLYECEEDGKNAHRLTKKQINLAQFAELGKKPVQIKMEDSILDLQIFLERQDDDSKSVNTFSTNNEQRGFKFDKTTQKTPIQKGNNLSSRSRSPDKNKPPQSTEGKKRKRQLNLYQTIQQVKEESKEKVNDQFEFQTHTDNKQQKQNQNQPQFNNGESEQLQSFILKRTLKQKEQQIYAMKKQNQQLQKTIQKLIEQNLAKRNNQTKNQSSKQTQLLKANLTKKLIEIDSLQTEKRLILQRQKQYETTIVDLRQKVGQYRNRLTQTKYRQAYLLQQLFEMGDKGVLEIANKYLAK